MLSISDWIQNEGDVLKGPFTRISNSTQYVNGKMTSKKEVIYTYVLRISTLGEHSLSPINIRVKNKDYFIEDLVINVE